MESTTPSWFKAEPVPDDVFNKGIRWEMDSGARFTITFVDLHYDETKYGWSASGTIAFDDEYSVEVDSDFYDSDDEYKGPVVIKAKEDVTIEFRFNDGGHELYLWDRGFEDTDNGCYLGDATQHDPKPAEDPPPEIHSRWKLDWRHKFSVLHMGRSKRVKKRHRTPVMVYFLVDTTVKKLKTHVFKGGTVYKMHLVHTDKGKNYLYAKEGYDEHCLGQACMM